MGAAGLLAAWQFLNKPSKFDLNAFMPAFAAAVLVSLLSQGEKTDVWAHVFGYLSGLFYGIFLYPVLKAISHKNKEAAAMAVTLIIICLSFFMGQV